MWLVWWDTVEMCVSVMRTILPLLSHCFCLHLGSHAAHIGFPSSPEIASKCGTPQVRNPMRHTLRVVGGTEARHGSHPWLVSLHNKGSHFCGGAILTERWILTAAHCFMSTSKDFLSSVSVVVGEYDQGVQEEEEQIFLIKTVSVHEKYQHALPMSYDIALLELDEDIRMGAHVQPICLPLPSDNFPPKSNCIVAGWGRTKERGRLPTILREVQLDLVAPARCKYLLQTIRTSNQKQELEQPQIPLTLMCAGPERGGKDACQGDSGGPLVCPAQGSHGWVVLGVTSWGKGCGRSWRNNGSRSPSRRGSPGLFTDVKLLLPWIKSKLRQAEGQHRGRTPSKLCSVTDGAVTDREGVIRSPALPAHHYDNNELCCWFITVPPGYSILLEFDYLDLENDSHCAYDQLTVSIGTHRRIGTFCGSVLPGPILLNNSQSATLLFASDVSRTGRGFVVRHSAVKGHPGPGCGTVALVSDQDVVDSPNYPEFYNHNSVCHWIIYAPQHHVVKLDFVDFHLEESDGCLYDSLSVLGDVEGRETIAILCGSGMPPAVLSYDRVMLLRFTSDSSIAHAGFHATIAFISRTGLCGVGPPAEEAAQGGAALPGVIHLLQGAKYLCSGVLIHNLWILTSAHCTVSLQKGSLDRLSAVTTQPEKQTCHISRVILHPGYKPAFWEPDAALLQLSSPRCLTEHAQTVQMQDHIAEQGTLPINTCSVLAWAESTGHPGSITTYTDQVSLVSHDECERYFTTGLADAMLCVTPQHRFMDGLWSALVCQRSDSTSVLLGIRSGMAEAQTRERSSRGKEELGRSQRPAMFTSVTVLRDWIHEQIYAVLDVAEPVDQQSSTGIMSQQEAVDQHSMDSSVYVDLSSDDEDCNRESSGWEK